VKFEAYLELVKGCTILTLHCTSGFCAIDLFVMLPWVNKKACFEMGDAEAVES